MFFLFVFSHCYYLLCLAHGQVYLKLTNLPALLWVLLTDEQLRLLSNLLSILFIPELLNVSLWVPEFPMGFLHPCPSDLLYVPLLFYL